MARKTRKPRTTRPAATTSKTDTPDIADAETLPGNESDAAADATPPVSEGDDTILAAEPVPEETVTPADTLAGDDTLLSDDTPVAGDAEALSDRTSAVEAEGDATVLADDTVPPEDDPADIADLERLDGATVSSFDSADTVHATGDTLRPADESLHSAGDPGTEGVLMGEVRSDDARGDTASAPILPAIAAPQPEARSGPGFLPLVLGGLIAGAIGYAIPTFLAPDAPAVDEARIVALESRLDGLPAGETVDLSGLEATQAELSERVDTLAARLDALEAAPAGASAAEQSAGASTAAPANPALAGLPDRVASLSDRVDALAAQVEALPTPPPDLTDRVAALEAELGALGEETQAVEVSAEQRAREAAANQLRIAVDSGAAYAEPLGVIGGDVPAALADTAESGVPTLDALRADFPAAARAALTEARIVDPAAETGLAGFLRRQTGARSLEPREGDDADAVLSRADAALAEGDVAAAVTELEALPDEARDVAEMADWLARAEARVAARSALQDYLGTE